MGDDAKLEDKGSGLSRREFLRLSGLSITLPLLTGHRTLRLSGKTVDIYGPGKVPITLTVNGKKYKADLEPRVTLLDALRHELDLTGAKRVCDRGTCGSCTVIMDGKPVYACTILAIDAQSQEITTIEGLLADGKLRPIQEAFVDNDAQQCGFCTPGFVVAVKAFLDRNPNPSPDDVNKELGGNLCRCGTYMGIRAAAVQASKEA